MSRRGTKYVRLCVPFKERLIFLFYSLIDERHLTSVSKHRSLQSKVSLGIPLRETTQDAKLKKPVEVVPFFDLIEDVKNVGVEPRIQKVG